MTTFNAASFSTAELVDMYNTLTGKSIKRFASRKAAERQTSTAIAAKEEADAFAEQAERQARKDAAEASGNWSRTCPGCGGCQDITHAGLDGTAAADRHFCHHCETEWFPDTGKLYTAPKASPSRAASIAASWALPDVAAARAARSTVTVRGGGLKKARDFTSLRAAFAALSLPMGQHIKFRGQLKAAGTLAFVGYTFVNHTL